ncbi:MAG: type II methionyl aminopeptidase [Candidatus Aenigmarchaeota archaeon]|nr:type II methionyl aminopeptidase [Candidatus Aenigmarchaeota archaeon]
MDKKILEKYMKAGKIAAEVREASKELVKPGASLLGIAEELEKIILEKGAEIAFPINISLNDAAAHYTPYKGETTVIRKDDIVKIDIGVHIDGYIGDTAYTAGWNEKHNKLIEASQKALEAAIEMCRPGVNVSDIGAKVEEVIEGYGFRPISNLTGHGLEKNNLHAEPQIPNTKNSRSHELAEDQVIAIEPFATNGAGHVKDSEPTLIYALFRPVLVRSPAARDIINYAASRNGLPFAERWLPLDSRIKIKLALRELTLQNAVYGYPVLKEAAGGMISQAEHTIIVRDEPIVTTKM